MRGAYAGRLQGKTHRVTTRSTRQQASCQGPLLDDVQSGKGREMLPHCVLCGRSTRNSAVGLTQEMEDIRPTREVVAQPSRLGSRAESRLLLFAAGTPCGTPFAPAHTETSVRHYEKLNDDSSLEQPQPYAIQRIPFKLASVGLIRNVRCPVGLPASKKPNKADDPKEKPGEGTPPSP